MNPEQPPRASRLWLSGGAVVLAAVLVYFAVEIYRRYGSGTTIVPPPVRLAPTPNLPQRVQLFCGACHQVPSPKTFRRQDWEDLIERMYLVFQHSGKPLQPPPFEEVVQYYKDRAPEELPPADIRRADHPLPLHFERLDYPLSQGPPAAMAPHISNVQLVHFHDPKKLDVLACDMMGGAVMLLQPYLQKPQWHTLYAKGESKGFNPAHAEVVDLDKDGVADILVANLGSFPPTEDLCGSVLWLRGRGKGQFDPPITLLKGKGRIADVQAADFNGDGKLDLIVACFGCNTVGEIYYLENRTSDWNEPRFDVKKLDDRHGTIHVPIADLNGDGKPDFIALISQENETIVAFLNDGKGNFTPRELYKAPHPGYGSSGIQLVDLNGDGKLDVLYTNGDVLDKPYLLKPYHGIQWLENKGDLKFEHHWLTPMYGVHRAVAADLDGDGDLDIVAVSYLPEQLFKQRKAMQLDAVVVLEQTAPGVFARHSLVTEACDHTTCVLGDVFGTGKIDIVTGAFTNQSRERAITIWKNLGR
jgi:hypothetical protein